MNYIGIDIGTTTICGVVLGAEGRLLASAQRPNAAGLVAAQAWERVQDPARILAAVEELLTGLRREFGELGGIGVTGQMHGILYVNAAGQAVSPLYTWQDGRGDQPHRDGQSCAAWLAAASGYPVATGMGAVTHAYNTYTNGVPPTATGFCAIQDYIAMRLTGRAAPVTDPTDAASFGLFDLRKLEFDAAALAKVGLDPRLFPAVQVKPGPIGRTPDGLPVCAAVGDNQASFLGSVAAPETTVLVNVGTGSQVSVFTREFLQVPGLETRPFPGGGYLLVGAPLCGGRAYALLKDFFRRTLELFGAVPTKDVYAAMTAAATRALEQPQASGASLAVDTTFSGTRQEPQRRGSIHNLGLDTFTPEALTVGVLDGVAAELHELFLRLPAELRSARPRLVGSGNGLRLNPALRQLFAQRFARPLELAAYEEEAACGAACLAHQCAVRS